MRQWRTTFAALAVLCVVMGTQYALALRGRVFHSRTEIEVANSNEGARALHDLGVKGRIVVLLGSHTRTVHFSAVYPSLDVLREKSELMPATRQNLITVLQTLGIARRVYVVPLSLIHI